MRGKQAFSVAFRRSHAQVHAFARSFVIVNPSVGRGCSTGAKKFRRVDVD
jgi:hypothetical protein